jgi:hypothetical protein
LSWEWASADTFENRAFACRLVTTYHKLGQRNVIANPESPLPVSNKRIK